MILQRRDRGCKVSFCRAIIVSEVRFSPQSTSNPRSKKSKWSTPYKIMMRRLPNVVPIVPIKIGTNGMLSKKLQPVMLQPFNIEVNGQIITSLSPDITISMDDEYFLSHLFPEVLNGKYQKW